MVSGLEFPSAAGGKKPGRDCIAQGRVRRPARLLGLSARTACEAAVLGMRGKLTGADATEFHERTAQRYVELLGHSKGVLMKAGQMLSFIPASFMVAPEYRPIYDAALARLRNDVPAMKPELGRAVLEREIGPIDRTFAEFDPEPFAAASIGQVHAARLHDGRAVAVKIQYPGASDAIMADLKNAELLAAFISLLLRTAPKKRSRADIRGMARELSVRVREEVDYELEAASQSEFADFYRGHPFIHIPEIVSELCTDRVLCQELVQGFSWDQALNAGQHLRNQWAEVIFRFIHCTGVRFGVYHGDPHPGNYLFHEDGSVSFLDFGCVKHFTPEQARYKTIIGAPVINGDALGTWQACIETGLLRPTDPVTPEEVLAYWTAYIGTLSLNPPAVITPELLGAWMERCLSLHGPYANTLRHSTVEPTYILLNRIEFGTTALISHLRPCIDWPAITLEVIVDAPPLTELGRLERAFVNSCA
jgi:predicted unusual protein kinase regulating ubiquinone biosynthesis (AarF/ABC1/UbiB family)